MLLLKKQNIITLLLTILTLCFAPYALAKSINLYEEPKTEAKVVANIDSTAKMVPIITSKEGDWMKIGDPSNGNVGWLKVSEVEDNGGSFTGFTLTQHTVTTNKGPRTVQTIQFSAPQVMSAQESAAMAKRMQLRQEELQRSIQKVMGEFYKEMSIFFNNNRELFDDTSWLQPKPKTTPEKTAPTVPPLPNNPEPTKKP